MEPLQAAGFVIEGINDMTGLPEYRNGGLLVDLGFLVPKQADITLVPQLPESDVVVEWRALTVASLDHIAAALRAELGVDAATFPLVKVCLPGLGKGPLRAQLSSPMWVRTRALVPCRCWKAALGRLAAWLRAPCAPTAHPPFLSTLMAPCSNQHAGERTVCHVDALAVVCWGQQSACTDVTILSN